MNSPLAAPLPKRPLPCTDSLSVAGDAHRKTAYGGAASLSEIPERGCAGKGRPVCIDNPGPHALCLQKGAATSDKPKGWHVGNVAKPQIDPRRPLHRSPFQRSSFEIGESRCAVAMSWRVRLNRSSDELAKTGAIGQVVRTRQRSSSPIVAFPPTDDDMPAPAGVARLGTLPGLAPFTLRRAGRLDVRAADAWSGDRRFSGYSSRRRVTTIRSLNSAPASLGLQAFEDAPRDRSHWLHALSYVRRTRNVQENAGSCRQRRHLEHFACRQEQGFL